MVQPTRLQFLLRRLGTPSHHALTWNPIPDHLSVLDRGSRRSELTLCALFESHHRLRTSATLLASAGRRITAHRIRRKLSDGRLPYQRAATIFGGPGRGGHCEGCDAPLLRTQLVMEIPRRDEPLAHLHGDCFQLWEVLRREPRDRRPDPEPPFVVF